MRVGGIWLLLALLASCLKVQAPEAVEKDGGKAPVICTRKNTLDMCRDKAGGFWICDGLANARCLRTTDPQAAFAVDTPLVEAKLP